MKKFFYLVLILFSFIDCSSVRNKFLIKDYSKLSLKLKVYPKTETLIPRKDLPSILLYEPILLNKESLFRDEDNIEKGIIPFLNEAGYDVFVAFNEFKLEPDLKAHGFEIGELIHSITTSTQNEEIILGGLSVGGQAILNHLSLPEKAGSKAKIKKIFFIGTGGDYNYPNNFVEKMESMIVEKTYPVKGCYKDEKDNFCNRFVKKNNSNENLKDWKNYTERKVSYVNYLPNLNKDLISNISEENLKIPMFIAYGKIDSISPEESIYPLIQKVNPENHLSIWQRIVILSKETFTKYKKEPRSKVLELSRANNHSIDYDHFDLFLYEKKGIIFNDKVEKDLYYPLVKWLKD